jgi:hypothetical protein
MNRSGHVLEALVRYADELEGRGGKGGLGGLEMQQKGR